MADRWLGNFLQKAHELGVMENTLLLLISDHGHALGEHGYVGKPAHALWPELTDIVFFIRYPGGKGADEVSDYFASTHDVAPTILSLLGIGPPKPMEGQDLSVVLDDREPGVRQHFTLAYGEHVWSRDEQYVMFARNDGAEAKLYDLRTDPNMNTDIAGSNLGIVSRMWSDYVLADAGGPLPKYQNVRPF